MRPKRTPADLAAASARALVLYSLSEVYRSTCYGCIRVLAMAVVTKAVLVSTRAALVSVPLYLLWVY